MSFLHRILHRTFSSTSLESSISTKSIFDELYKERDLKALVHKFKKASENPRFRAHNGIYDTTVRRLTISKRFNLVEEILQDQKKYSDIEKEGFSARLITLFGKAGLCENAHKMFDELPDRNCERTVISLNALLTAYLHSKKYDMVGSFFKKLPLDLCIEPNLVTYNIVIKAYCEMGNPDLAISLLEEMGKKGIDPDLISYNTLLDWLYRNGRFGDGEKLWGQMDEKNVCPNVRSYNARLRGLVKEKKIKDGVELFEKMKNEGVKPDMFTFNTLIKGFVDVDDLDEAKKWYTEISKSEHDPNKITYITIVPFLCKKGDLTSAFELCKDIFNIRCIVHPSILQLVVDSLVKQSMITEAEAIVQLGKMNGYRRYKLNLEANDVK